MSRRAVVAGTAGLLLVAAGGALAVSRGDGAGAADSPPVTTPRETTTVERRDLVQTEEVGGASATATASRSPGTAAW